jgi:Repeat of Unknown Function (DUF347)
MVDAPYWISMFIAGALGTVIGDYCSHDLHLGDAGGSLLLVPVLALLFVIARNGLLRWLPYYWLTIVAVRAAGTCVGDFVAGRNMLGLPLSTLVTGILFVARRSGARRSSFRRNSDGAGRSGSPLFSGRQSGLLGRARLVDGQIDRHGLAVAAGHQPGIGLLLGCDDPAAIAFDRQRALDA